MTQYRKNDKLLAQNFQESFVGTALSWFTKLEMSKIILWVDLAGLLVKEYKFNAEFAPDKEEL